MKNSRSSNASIVALRRGRHGVRLDLDVPAPANAANALPAWEHVFFVGIESCIANVELGSLFCAMAVFRVFCGLSDRADDKESEKQQADPGKPAPLHRCHLRASRECGLEAPARPAKRLR